MRHAAFNLLAFFCSLACAAQQSKYTAYTVNDGLPSNYVYRCVEDNKGFLWVATDAGMARFDGKHFQVFTTKDGLPDNEVLSVVKENNGRIWVNCFKQKPAWFDEVKNRFINSTEDISLAKVQEGTGVMYFFPLQSGGIMFYNERGSFIYKNKNLTSYPKGKRNDGFLIKQNKDGTQLKFGSRAATDTVTKIWQSKIYQCSSAGYSDSIVIKHNKYGEYFTFGVSDDKVYMFDWVIGKCYIYINFTTSPIRFRLDSVTLPEPFYNFDFTAHSFYIIGNSAKVYLYNKKNLRQEAVIGGNYLPNSTYRDSKGDIWVSTIDKGLLVYKKKQFDTVKMPPGFSNINFLSIARKPDSTLLAGNFYGEVVESKGNKAMFRTIAKKGLVARQHKILLSQNKVFTFSEAGIYVNYTRNLGGYGKTAIVYNDSILIVGQSMGLEKLNSKTEKLTRLNVLGKRVTALARDAGGMIYFGSTDGLYKYNYSRDSARAINKNDPLLGERVTALCTTPDKLLWVATSGSGIAIVKDDKLLFHISEKEGIINNATRCIASGKPGQVWLGTAGGISVINYSLRNGKISYTLQNLSVNDGLTNNVVNEMLYQKDTVYAATGNGITVIPANIAISKFNIPVQLTNMTVNQRDTVLSSSYKLAYDQHNVQMEFAGIELGGHFKNLQYTLDKNKNWIDLDENILTVQLSSGNHTVQVRAVDVNGNISDKILTIKFDIKTPFWKAIWFWILTAVEIQLIVLFVVNRWQKKRREVKLEKEIAGVQMASLEQQAFTSLMNPHFLFNALNSIQHYINLQERQNANRYLSDFASLIRKNFEAAQQSFIPLEQEIENIKIYLRLEQMRFSERFSYQLQIDKDLDIEDWMIPTMILQPLLENALLHGIMPSSIDGKLVIDFKEQDRNLLIVIADNGIGVANSLALKDTDNQHKSRGMELIQKRIAALSRFGSHPITITMSPAFPGEKNPGNKATLLIPHGLHQAWLQAQQPK